MNRRQKIKALKQQIKSLQYDNYLIHKLLENYPEQQRLYDEMTRWKLRTTTMHFEEYRGSMNVYDGISIEATKKVLADKMLLDIRKEIEFECVEDTYSHTRLNARIFIGRET